MRTAFSLRVGLVVVLSLAGRALAAPGVLSIPALYDNSDPSLNYGQLFQATEPWISGIDFYIGDPTRPADTAVNGLSGVAYLNLYDETNPDALILLESSEVQDANGYAFGLSTFNLATPYAATPGNYYDLAIQTDDQFGLGLTNQNSSTYPPGYESDINNGVIGKAGGNDRDTSFLVLNSAPVPEPTSAAISGLLATLLLFRRRKPPHRNLVELTTFGSRQSRKIGRQSFTRHPAGNRIVRPFFVCEQFEIRTLLSNSLINWMQSGSGYNIDGSPSPLADGSHAISGSYVSATIRYSGGSEVYIDIDANYYPSEDIDISLGLGGATFPTHGTFTTSTASQSNNVFLNMSSDVLLSGAYASIRVTDTPEGGGIEPGTAFSESITYNFDTAPMTFRGASREVFPEASTPMALHSNNRFPVHLMQRQNILRWFTCDSRRVQSSVILPALLRLLYRMGTGTRLPKTILT